MQNTIYQHNVDVYVNGKWKKGTLCAHKEQGGTISIGTAICSLKDKYCKRSGRDQALERALTSTVQWEFHNTPQFNEFLLRSLKYFQGTTYKDIVYDVDEEYTTDE